MSGAVKKLAGDTVNGETETRALPGQIDIPYINGEMVHLRPATIADLTRMDDLQAFYNSTGITGKDPQAERALVSAWVRRSVAWSKGNAPYEHGVGDPEARRTVAWSMIAHTDSDGAESNIAGPTDGLIGMVFLIDIDGWSRSARIQVVLGKDFRGRGYSRDAMPRVMTYGYAASPEGLDLHRIWVAVPEKNPRAISVYQSLGFVLSGTSRDALWDEEGGKYQDQIVMDALADEYDPIQSLEAFGMHLVEGNPGVDNAVNTRKGNNTSGRSEAITEEEPVKPNNHGKPALTELDHFPEIHRGGEDSAEAAKFQVDSEHRTTTKTTVALPLDEEVKTESGQDKQADEGTEDNATTWAYSDSNMKKSSKRAWWRNLGHNMKGNSGGNS